MADPIIEVKNLNVIYNKGKSNEVRSLEGADLKIYPHEYIIIFGPSGCGKSTLLYSISGLQAPTTGEVIIEGKNISHMTKKEKVVLHQSGIGMVFQAFYLISSITILDNVCLPKVFRGEDKKKRNEKGLELLKRFGIEAQSNKFPEQLSGGQKQRASIARSLVNEPQIILADEPVGNLDSESAQNVLDILKDINEQDKKTIIMVTHNPEHLRYADRVIRMKDGHIIGEEINHEKRPEKAVEEGQISGEKKEEESVPNEVRILMRTFKNFSSQQIGALLVPFKAKQLLTHVISELTEEQLNTAENFLKDVLFKNIGIKGLQDSLDLDFEKGGAGWNKLRAESFSRRIGDIMEQVETIKTKPSAESSALLADYLINIFKVKMDPEIKQHFQSFLKLRIDNKIDGAGLDQRLDAPINVGGVGLYRNTAEKMTKEIEILMLLRYSS